jgi:aspartate kinase
MTRPRVMKFGGSSVADAVCLRRVARLVVDALPAAPLVVVSAMGKTTDALFAAAEDARRDDLAGALSTLAEVETRHRAAAADLFDGREPESVLRLFGEAFDGLRLLLRGVALLRELTPRTTDAIVSHGELLSSGLLAALLQSLPACGARWVDARRVMKTDAAFGGAEPRPARLRELAGAHVAPHLGAGRVVVTQGYVGATDDGSTTTLGRGGSDYSAALFGAALDAAEVQIWTDVEGVLTCDPRVVPGAQPVPELAFEEAAELAAFGAKVLHPATIQPAVESGIPVTVRHTERPGGRFTTIRGHVATGRAGSSGRPGALVTALAGRGPLTILTVTSTRMLEQSGFLARLFDVFARHRVSVDLVATAEVSVSLTVDRLPGAALGSLVEELSRFARVDVREGRALVAVIGERLRSTSGVAARAFGALGDLNVEMISMGANEINLSLVVGEESRDEALRRLHRVFFELSASAGDDRAVGGCAPIAGQAQASVGAPS